MSQASSVPRNSHLACLMGRLTSKLLFKHTNVRTSQKTQGHSTDVQYKRTTCLGTKQK